MRVEGRGHVERDQTVRFRFDGRELSGFRGDTLASALLANGVRLVGRSFKYHRPRGIVTAGSEEPNALVTVGRGSDQTPNVRATVQEIFDGLEARSQNRWPSLTRDVLSVNDLLHPFLSAGFYYKTFMWPRGFWEKVYEPLIRRAAGLGALSGEPDTGRYERAWAFCDVLVIGSGPAGLMAALTAARGGADVILCEEDSRLGGRLLSETIEIGGMPGASWVEAVRAELAAMTNVRLMTRTTVTGAYDHGTYSALERVALHQSVESDLPREAFWRIVADRCILAAGAIERHIAFPDNDRPGIMGAGAARSYLNRWGVSPGQVITVFCNNDDGHRTARDFADAGVAIAGVVDTRSDPRTSGDYPVYSGGEVVATRGRFGLKEITIRHDGQERRIETDCLAVSGGWNPSVHLTCHLNGRPVWREDIGAFVPSENAVPGLEACGAANGVFATARCLDDGARAGSTALKHLGLAVPEIAVPEAEDAAYAISPFWLVEGKGRAWLDFQNDVTAKDVRLAAQENFRSVEHMKRYTTQGMATDQGKTSNVTALAILADATGRSIPQTGTTTFRPPYAPVSIAAIGAGGGGQGFAPQRFAPSHAAAVECGASIVEAGLWYRPAYFPKEAEASWRESCDREVTMVRTRVGITDVSTLGKIDIQGPDAAEFLDFVYTNTFSTLKTGRVRYGLMLREDGHVMDDGTSARLGEHHYLMTTTTAAAGQVMQHLQFVHQCLKPGLDVRMVSATEQWAQFAVAGPLSRELLNGLLATPIDDDGWPFMACGPVTVHDVPGRLFRISFSGEHAYEVAVPARYGESLWRLLLSQAKALGGGPYGTEALNVLRIEKGHVTHAEIHGRTTASDIGMERMVSRKKDCIGKSMAGRPGLNAPDREQLVGLRPANGTGRIVSGAHLYPASSSAGPDDDHGYVTSAAYSPTLGQHVALGFLKKGRERLGEGVRAVDRLQGIETLCEVTHPVFYDPEGVRLRG